MTLKCGYRGLPLTTFQPELVEKFSVNEATPEPHGLPKVAFISAGRSPRKDLIREILESLDFEVDATEIGALDDLSAAEIDSLRVHPGDTSIVSRLDDTTKIILSKQLISERMAAVAASIPSGAFDLIVILSTGLLRDFVSHCPTVNTQRAVESTIISLAARGDSVGLIQPLRRQISEFDIPALSEYRVMSTHAYECDETSLERAVGELRGCDVIVLNSVSYTEADRQFVARASGQSVVLARRIMASAIRLLLSGKKPPGAPPLPSALEQKLELLTPRESQVLSLAAEGLGNKEIARQLGISPKTVEIHRSNLMRKMEVSSSGALIRLVVEAGYR